MNETSPNSFLGNCSSPADAVTPPPEEQLSYFQSAPSLVGNKTSDDCLVEVAQNSPGHTLPEEYEDSVLCDENVTLLGRIGRKLAAFKGTGYVQVENGKAKLVDSFPVKVRQLWHFFNRVAGRTVLGDPKPSPFIAVVNEAREVSAMAGLESGVSQLVHDPEKGGWGVQSSAKVPKQHFGKLEEAASIQLTGYVPQNPLVSDQTIRELKVLGGQGIPILKQIPAPPTTVPEGCPSSSCETNLQTVVELIPFPDPLDPCSPDVECFTLKYCGGELKFVADTETSLPESLVGNA